MSKDIVKEHNKRESKYAYEIGLLLQGMSVEEIYGLSKNMGAKASRRTLFRLKKEFIDDSPVTNYY